MPESLTYLLVNLGALSVPFAFSFHPKLRFDKTWGAFFPACLMVGAGFIAWDIWFTEMGVWGFNPRYLSAYYLANLPIEEWLFFLCIPYASIFTYHCLKVLVKNDFIGPYARTFSLFLAAVFFLTALFNLDKWYTALTFLLTVVFLIFHVFVIKGKYLGYFYLSFLVIIPFFLLTNGILTGSWIEEQVVWYNNAENLGIRVGTIPVEDFVYGFLLLLMIATIYEWLLGRRSRN